jgi:hypothetical protein
MDTIMANKDTEMSDVSTEDPIATIRNLMQSPTFAETTSPYVIRDQVPSQSPGVYQQKCLVVEKMSPAISQLKGDLEYTKAKNRDLKRMAIQERERVSAAYIEGERDSHKGRARSLQVRWLPQIKWYTIFKQNRQI